MLGVIVGVVDAVAVGVTLGDASKLRDTAALAMRDRATIWVRICAMLSVTLTSSKAAGRPSYANVEVISMFSPKSAF